MDRKDFKVKRVMLDLTQAELAEELGLRAQTISRYETGDLRIPRAVELAMEALLNRQRNRPEQE